MELLALSCLQILDLYLQTRLATPLEKVSTVLAKIRLGWK